MATAKTPEQFKKELKQTHPKIKLLSNYSGWRARVEYMCMDCGIQSAKYSYSLLTKGCGTCNRKVSDKPHANRFSPEEYKQKVKTVHGKAIKVIGEYIGGRNRIMHECNSCSNKWDALPEHILRGVGCNKCRGKSLTQREQEHKANLKQRHGTKIKLLTFGGVSKRTSKSEYLCSCGNTWKTSAATVEKHGCPACAPRKGRNGNRLKTLAINRRTFQVQGYEGYAIEWLVKNTKIKASEIEVYASGKVPFIKWNDGKKDRYHFPDIYIKKLNMLCEVKSVSTFGLKAFKRSTPNSMFKSIRQKAIEALNQGFKYKMLLMKDNGERIKLPKNWFEMSLRELKSKVTI